MRNPLDTKTERKANGSLGPLDIQFIERMAALAILSQVRRQGIFRPYIPYVLDALGKIKGDQSITFHVPVIPGRNNKEAAKRLMSTINMVLRKKQIPHRLRYFEDEHLLISEKIEW